MNILEEQALCKSTLARIFRMSDGALKDLGVAPR